MKDINQKIDEIILKYQMDKYYPIFRERRNEMNRCRAGDFSSVVTWNDDYYCINDGLVAIRHLMDRIDATVFEVDVLLNKLTTSVGEEKRQCLQRLFFLAIYKRNFLLAEEMVQQLVQDFPEEVAYKKAWEEINALIEQVKRELKNRKYEDIVGIWIDAVTHKDINEIPYLEEASKANNTISFLNAYTMTPCTNPTFALIMTGKKRVDDRSYLIKKIDRSNSEVLALLEKEHYLSRFIGSYWKQLDDHYKSEVAHYIYAPCSEILWDMACSLLNAESKAFVMTHIMAETHWPYISMNQRTSTENITDIRRLRGRDEVDRQLRYYIDFLGEDATRLYFSDHGDKGSSKDVFHTVLEIQGKDFKKEEIEEVFSYEKFSELLKFLILRKEIDKSLLISDYAEIQEIPLYNKSLIARKIKNEGLLSSNEIWGYRGIIDCEYMYLCFGETSDGVRESLIENGYKDNFSEILFPGCSYICNDDVVSHYREMLKEKNIFLGDDKYFRYTRYLQKVAERAMPIHIRKLKLLHEFFCSLPDRGIALRGGGIDTRRILLFYEKELKGVEYIIDNDKNCLCAASDIRIISTADVDQYPIRTIILASKKYIKEFREEAHGYPMDIQVLDIYEYLRGNGIIEENSFYYFQPSREDYDVGFPFDE